MRFFGLKSCDTCRKARKAITEAGLDITVIDVRDDGIPEEDLVRIVDTFGDKAINRASTTWRALDDTEKQQDTLALLRAHPTLLKRPVIDTGNGLTQGWKADVQAQVLGDRA